MEKPAAPVVSVVIPTYNQAELLEKALRSVLDQTFHDWEVIVVDNFSTDNTRDIVEKFQDCRFRYLQCRNNGIIAASRNLGVKHSNGGYIAFLDSDDLWYPSKLSTALEYLSKGADAVCHGMWIRSDGNPMLKNIPQQPKGSFFEALLFLGNSIITTSTVVVKRDWLIHYDAFSEDPQIVTAEDYDLWLRLLKNNISWKVIPEVLGEYIIHGKNESKNIQRQMDAEEAVVLRYFNEMPSHSFGIQMRMKKRRMMIAFRAGKRAFDAGFFQKSIPFFMRGLTNIWSK